MKNQNFAICIFNEGLEASLLLNKVYEVIPDESASKNDLLKVIDESGEDYLFPKNYFVPIEVPSNFSKVSEIF